METAFPPVPVDERPSKAEEGFYADKGLPRMSSEVLRECCTVNNGYSSPELNDVLILHYKGFRKIENLEKYSNVKTLFVECNGITRIENLEVMPLLYSLYMQSNCISRIENLGALSSLQYLNLANNSISVVENLGGLPSLQTLNLATNKITEVDALRGLAECPALKSVDISQNYIEDGDALVAVWPQLLPGVECLYMHHNPCSRGLKDFRRRMISSLGKLRWLDERLVTPIERAGCQAWATGGKDAELEAKQECWRREKEGKDRSFQSYRAIASAAAERARVQKEQAAARGLRREGAAGHLAATGSLEDGWCVAPSPAADADAEASENRRASGEARLARQAARRFKMEAFLQSRGKTLPDAQLAESNRRRAAATTLLERDGAAAASASPPEALPAQPAAPCAAAAAEGLAAEQEASEAAAEVAAAVAATLGPIEWTTFRDRRLGRLAAECKYDFARTADALSEEFGQLVSADGCRQRYGELLRPPRQEGVDAAAAAAAARQRLRADAGRAKDAPVDAAAVADFSDWWVRRLRMAAKDTAPSTALLARSAPTAEVAEPSAGSAARDATSEAVEGASSPPALRAGLSAPARAASGSGSGFAPPVRAARAVAGVPAPTEAHTRPLAAQPLAAAATASAPAARATLGLGAATVTAPTRESCRIQHSELAELD